MGEELGKVSSYESYFWYLIPYNAAFLFPAKPSRLAAEAFAEAFVPCFLLYKARIVHKPVNGCVDGIPVSV